MKTQHIILSSKRLMMGFTLVEMAIVLVIFGLMLAMFLSPLSAQRDIQNRAKTQALLNEAKEALMGFAVINGYLPCPDTDDIPDGEDDRKSDDTCDNNGGVLPWNTLGIDRTDAWGRYFNYRVDATFANSNKLFTLNDAEGASGITINGEDGLALISQNSRPSAIIVSHGANGYGAINTNQDASTNIEPVPTSADELENADNNVTFVSHPPAAKGTANTFDDMLIWISPKVLINRMIMAERLP